MKRSRVGERVRWNSAAGRVTGTIFQRFTANVRWEDSVHHASHSETQYFIKSDATDHLAIHKGTALLPVPKARRSKRDNRR